jgi:hypothetical protein
MKDLYLAVLTAIHIPVLQEDGNHEIDTTPYSVIENDTIYICEATMIDFKNSTREMQSKPDQYFVNHTITIISSQR